MAAKPKDQTPLEERVAAELDGMTVDEMIAWRVAKKAEAEAVKAELRASNAIYRAAVEEDRLADIVRANKLPPGTRIIVPTLEVGLTGHDGGGEDDD